LFCNLLCPYTAHPDENENCTDRDLRLIDGTTSLEGRVEMCYERRWGTVCDDLWGANDAKVACRQLGFSSLGRCYKYCFKSYRGTHKDITWRWVLPAAVASGENFHIIIFTDENMVLLRMSLCCL